MNRILIRGKYRMTIKECKSKPANGQLSGECQCKQTLFFAQQLLKPFFKPGQPDSDNIRCQKKLCLFFGLFLTGTLFYNIFLHILHNANSPLLSLSMYNVLNNQYTFHSTVHVAMHAHCIYNIVKRFKM